MASRSFSKALRSPLGRQLASPQVQRRTFVSAMGAVRATAVSASRPAAHPVRQQQQQQQVRGVKTMDFAGSKEEVYGELNLVQVQGARGGWSFRRL